ncbi:hypothetical protein GQX74_014459 [Glossina fuscipes]|nr:hypothetical protein GQX74_014459 [Glossina fuscipes]
MNGSDVAGVVVVLMLSAGHKNIFVTSPKPFIIIAVVVVVVAYPILITTMHIFSGFLSVSSREVRMVYQGSNQCKALVYKKLDAPSTNVVVGTSMRTYIKRRLRLWLQFI